MLKTIKAGTSPWMSDVQGKEEDKLRGHYGTAHKEEERKRDELHRKRTGNGYTGSGIAYQGKGGHHHGYHKGKREGTNVYKGYKGNGMDIAKEKAT